MDLHTNQRPRIDMFHLLKCLLLILILFLSLFLNRSQRPVCWWRLLQTQPVQVWWWVRPVWLQVKRECVNALQNSKCSTPRCCTSFDKHVGIFQLAQATPWDHTSITAFIMTLRLTEVTHLQPSPERDTWNFLLISTEKTTLHAYHLRGMKAWFDFV